MTAELLSGALEHLSASTQQHDVEPVLEQSGGPARPIPVAPPETTASRRV
ncbi:hypothetical protein [Aeromicrobium sp.]|nr:hypothetical protein [Aeromicrobium sp.]MBC7630986.1 hypothetical protein [Aeromicrobium sp.]